MSSYLNFTVRVNRAVRPVYPSWADPEWTDSPEFLALERSGPAEYNLRADVRQWLHNNQKTGVVRGQVIYDYLKKAGDLANQLGLADLLAIQAKGINVFRVLYAGNAPFGWKSVVRSRDSNLRVSYLHRNGGRVVVHWYWLTDDWCSYYPALRFGRW